MHRHTGGLHGGTQRVLGGEDIGDFVVEACPVPGADHVHEQSLGPSEPEALDEEQDPGTVPCGAGMSPTLGVSPGRTGRW